MFGDPFPNLGALLSLSSSLCVRKQPCLSEDHSLTQVRTFAQNLASKTRLVSYYVLLRVSQEKSRFSPVSSEQGACRFVWSVIPLVIYTFARRISFAFLFGGVTEVNMRQVLVIFALCLLKDVASYSQDDDELEEVPSTHVPKLLSSAIAVEATAGESVSFPCDVEDLGDFVILWKREKNRILFAGDLRISRDERIKTDGTSLLIKSVHPKDSGEYSCQISTNPPVELTHSLDVLYPPTVRARPKEGFITAKEGERISLICDASGNPVPTVTWKHAGRHYDSTEENSYVISNAQKNDSGEYECTADNSIGEPASAVITVEIVSAPKVQPEPANGTVVVKEGELISIGCKASGEPTPVITWKKPNGERMMKMNDENKIEIASASSKDAGNYECIANNSLGISASAVIRVQVLFAPKVHMSHSKIHAREGSTINITCIADGEPSPIITWKKDGGQAVHSAGRYHLKVHSHSHMLIIQHFQEEDFGTYECIASNTLSSATGTTHVLGKPHAPVITSKPHGTQGRIYTISWKVNTHTPIDEFAIMYRKKADDGEWETKTETITNSNDEDMMHTQMVQLDNLQPATEYEAFIKAKNKFGYSDESEHLDFTTKSEEKHSENYSSSSPASLSVLHSSLTSLLIYFICCKYIH